MKEDKVNIEREIENIVNIMLDEGYTSEYITKFIENIKEERDKRIEEIKANDKQEARAMIINALCAYANAVLEYTIEDDEVKELEKMLIELEDWYEENKETIGKYITILADNEVNAKDIVKYLKYFNF